MRGRTPASSDGDATLRRRLVAGRTSAALAQLSNTRLFQLDALDDLIPKQGFLQPQRGFQATSEGTDVVILDTFLRYRVPTADVATVEPEEEDEEGLRWSLGKTFSCPLGAVAHVVVRFPLNPKRRPKYFSFFEF